MFTVKLTFEFLKSLQIPGFPAKEIIGPGESWEYFFGEGLKWLQGDSFTYLEQNNPAELAYARANFAFLM